MKEEFNFTLENSQTEDFEIRDSNLLAELEQTLSRMDGSSMVDGDVRIISTHMDQIAEALFREGSFCADSIGYTLAQLLNKSLMFNDEVYGGILKDVDIFIKKYSEQIKIHTNDGLDDLLYHHVKTFNSSEVKNIFIERLPIFIHKLTVNLTVPRFDVKVLACYLSVFTQDELSKGGFDTQIKEILTSSSSRVFASVVSSFLENNNKLFDFGMGILRERLSLFGLSTEVLVETWKKNSKKFIDHYYFDAIKCICDLEDRIPGSTAILERDFGIRNFHRYPLDLLIRQYEERENTKIPYGVILYPLADHSGVFSLDRGKIFNHMSNTLKGNYAIRICECDTKFNVIRMLKKLEEVYGVQHKIEFMVIGGHGTKDSISFGGSNLNHQIRTKDLKHQKADHLSSFLTENPSIVLHSCETGIENGVAQEISQLLHGEVIAPDSSTTFRSIHASLGEGGVSFEVLFQDGLTKKYKNGTLVS